MPTYSTLVTSLRYYTGDIAEPYTYTDVVLNQFIVLAAVAVTSEITIMPTSYTIDIGTSTITPDPTSSESNIGLSNLFVLKAAVILSMSEARKDMAKYGVRIKDDLTSYDGTAALKGKQDVMKMYVDNYEKAKWEWEMGNKFAGRAILGPYESADLNYSARSNVYYPEYGPARR
jgi:hypothetical protein